MRFAAALVVMALAGFAGASCDRPGPCSPQDEDAETWGPTPAPLPGPGGPTEPGVEDDGESDGDVHGYSRNARGEVCACDLREAEEGRCSPDPPNDCDPQRGWNIETGECAPLITEQPVQDSKHYCGDVYWCCFELRCVSTDPKAKRDVPEMFVCPTHFGSADKSRAAAWKIWDYQYLTPALKALQAQFGDCWKRAGSCYETPPVTCGNYPN